MRATPLSGAGLQGSSVVPKSGLVMKLTGFTSPPQSPPWVIFAWQMTPPRLLKPRTAPQGQGSLMPPAEVLIVPLIFLDSTHTLGYDQKNQAISKFP